MLDDLAALAPSILVCVGCAIAVGALLRHEMGPAASRRAADESSDISADALIDGTSQAPTQCDGAGHAASR
jgi:hypothetical protein